MIKFLELRITGCGSIVNSVIYNLSQEGISCLIGENGSGKSTVFNTFYWVLFGKNLKSKGSVYPWPHVIPKDFKGSKAELDFNDGKNTYTIIRCQDYKGKVFKKVGNNKLFIAKDGVELTLRDKEDHKHWIKDKIGYSTDLFKNTIIFGQKTKRLLEEDGPTRKRILEETFDISFVHKANELAKSRLSSTQMEYNKLEDRIELQTTQLVDLRNDINKLKEERETFEQNKQKQIQEIKSVIESIRRVDGRLPDVEQLNFKLQTLNKKLKKTLKKINLKVRDEEFRTNFTLNQTKAELEILGRKILKITEAYKSVNKVCPSCEQPMPKKTINAYITQLKTELSEVKQKRRETSETIKELEEAYSGICKNLKSQQEFETKKNRLNLKIRELETKIQVTQLENRRNRELIQEKEKQIETIFNQEFTGNLEIIKARLQEHKANLKKYKGVFTDVNKQLKTLKWLISDPLSNGGIKAFIMDSMIDTINNHLIKYVKHIGFLVKLSINLSSSRKDLEISILRDNNEVPYNDLSGGQQQLVDVVVMFAINDSVNQSKPTNLLILDEPFERLSDVNVEIVADIIQSKAKTRCVHLITHQKSFQPISAHKIFFKLVKPGITIVQ